jgi:hypothetical protein
MERPCLRPFYLVHSGIVTIGNDSLNLKIYQKQRICGTRWRRDKVLSVYSKHNNGKTRFRVDHGASPSLWKEYCLKTRQTISISLLNRYLIAIIYMRLWVFKRHFSTIFQLYIDLWAIFPGANMVQGRNTLGYLRTRTFYIPERKYAYKYTKCLTCSIETVIFFYNHVRMLVFDGKAIARFRYLW